MVTIVVDHILGQSCETFQRASWLNISAQEPCFSSIVFSLTILLYHAPAVASICPSLLFSILKETGKVHRYFLYTRGTYLPRRLDKRPYSTRRERRGFTNPSLKGLLYEKIILSNQSLRNQFSEVEILIFHIFTCILHHIQFVRF